MGGQLTLPTHQTMLDLKADMRHGTLSPSKPTVRQALLEDRENMNSWQDTKPSVPAAVAAVPIQQQPVKVLLSI